MVEVNNLSFDELAEMNSKQFDIFLEKSWPYITQNLKSLYPDQKRFVFVHVEDILVLDSSQLARFLPDFKAWQGFTFKLLSFIPVPLIKLFKIKISHKMTWMDDGQAGQMHKIALTLQQN
jgi:hypothetical protein